MESSQESADGRQVIAFGIPSLDELLGHGRPARSKRRESAKGIGRRPESKTATSDGRESATGFGITLESKTESTSLCIIGPDGTGKSVLAMHLASHYAAQSSNKTRILYASTDLSIAKARTIWSNFALDRPFDRIVGLEKILDRGRARSPKPDRSLRIALDRYHPLILAEDGRRAAGKQGTVRGGPGSEDGAQDEPPALPLTDFLMNPSRGTCKQHEGQLGLCHLGAANGCKSAGRVCHRIAFVDLESSTAGDDWALINRLLATLNRPGAAESRHLLIIDAVEGLETLGGQRDLFGQVRERRSRIAQVLRAAKGKCHVVFIVEEVQDGSRLPEEFVSDAVIRLRVEDQRDYARRTIEIEKLRGQAYIRGQHDCAIRRGRGSRTGWQPNADHLDFVIDGQIKSYFLVVHSLNYLSREIMQSQLDHANETPAAKGELAPLASDDMRTFFTERQVEGLCSFGITYLDEMIGNLGRVIRPGELLARFSDTDGIPWGNVTALIGDEGTHKSRVGRAFLSKAFDVDRDARRLREGREKGVALLLTTQHIDNRGLARQFLMHHGFRKPDLESQAAKDMLGEIEDRTFCRRLEIHHMTSATLFQIVHALVQRGLKCLLGDAYPPRDGKLDDPARAHGRVRLVIDDWSGIQDTYPEIKNDPLFLPFLIFYLKRQGITTLIIDTQPGRFGHILSHESDRELRALVPYHIYTWHVRFFGEIRVAIAALPPISDNKPVVVRELKPYEEDEEELIVDPHFEYYDGFEDDHPRAVPLEVRLYQGRPAPPGEAAIPGYIAEVQTLFTMIWGREAPGVATELAGAIRMMASPSPPGIPGPAAANDSAGVLRAVSSAEYDLLRDFVYLQGASSLNRTLVVQLDEFWCWRHSSALSQLTEYLDAETSLRVYSNEEDQENRVRWRPNKVEDPFLLFQPLEDRFSISHAESLFPSNVSADSGQPPAAARPLRTADRTAARAPASSEVSYLRRHAFTTVGYDLDREAEAANRTSAPLDFRVPYTVDFGLVLASHARWRACFQEELPSSREARPRQPRKVGDIWSALQTYPPGTKRPGHPQEVTWREFLEACLMVSAQPCHGPALPAFDVDHTTPESLSCLVLEIWASELYRMENPPESCFRPGSYGDTSALPPVSRRGEPIARFGLLEAMEGDRRFRVALYRCWLLLGAVLPPERLPRERFRLSPSEAASTGVANRHWYSTACRQACSAAADFDEQWTPIRLPGFFTCRGDWDIAVSKGSRSRRLGERAIDILTSRRAQIYRMQQGLGLPVRGFPEDRSDEEDLWIDAEFRSPLNGYNEQGAAYSLRLNRLWWIGGQPAVSGVFTQKPGEPYPFYWLFRSRLNNYDRHAHIWSKWILYALERFHAEEMRGRSPARLLEAYEQVDDELKGKDVQKEFGQFDRYCNELRDALRRSTIPAYE